MQQLLDISLKKANSATQVHIIKKAETVEEKIEELQRSIKTISEMIVLLRKDKLTINNNKNYEGIPINTSFLGYADNNINPYILIVNKYGEYFVGNKKYLKLDDAATEVCGKPTKGVEFWRTREGTFLKDLN